VTIAHEMLYSEAARQALAEAPGLLEVLDALRRKPAPAAASGGDKAMTLATETTRVLAAELLRQLSAECSTAGGSSSSRSGRRKKSAGAQVWSTSLLAADSDATRCRVGWPWSRLPFRRKTALAVLSGPGDEDEDAGSMRRPGPGALWPERRAAAERFAAALLSLGTDNSHSSGSRGSKSSSASKGKVQAPSLGAVAAALDTTFRCLDELASSIEELRNELRGTNDDVNELASALLLSAAEVMKRLLDWKCHILLSSDDSEDGASMLGGSVAAALGRFLEEAVSVGNGLSACHAVFAARRPDPSSESEQFAPAWGRGAKDCSGAAKSASVGESELGGA